MNLTLGIIKIGQKAKFSEGLIQLYNKNVQFDNLFMQFH
jgi:hypothetical protein